MGYFSNGSEGVDFQSRYCNHCIHDIDNNCPVWFLHLVHNGEAEMQSTLDCLMPRKGITNECAMYHEYTRDELDKHKRAKREKDLLKAWAMADRGGDHDRRTA